MTVTQIRTMDEIDAGTKAEDWMQGVIHRIVPTDFKRLGWTVTSGRVPDGQPEAMTKITTLWRGHTPMAMYILQRDSANFTVATMIEVQT